MLSVVVVVLLLLFGVVVGTSGPLYTPINSKKHQSRNMYIRKALDLYANVVPVKHVKGIATRHSEGMDGHAVVQRLRVCLLLVCVAL
jgi:isocitrate dehydrogenase